MHGVDCGLVSVRPSNWNFTPVAVTWRREADGLDDREVEVDNWWDVGMLQAGLRNAEEPLRSWIDLQRRAESRFKRLVFTEDCFRPLDGVPFAGSAAERFLFLFDVLDRPALAHDVDGAPTPEAKLIRRDHFAGGGALFSDSSETEKRDFRSKLTFRHPRDGSPLFCPWHGKVRHMTLRLHYSWSGRAGAPVYVVYAGPKITRR